MYFLKQPCLVEKLDKAQLHCWIYFLFMLIFVVSYSFTENDVVWRPALVDFKDMATR